MKNYELLNMIGEVSEDYVLAANQNMTRPRSHWKAWAACAACAALVLGAYPVYRAANPPLHDYTVMEDGASLITFGEDIKAPAGDSIDTPGQGASDLVPAPDPGSVYTPNASSKGAYVDGGAGETDSPIDGSYYSAPGQDAPVQEKAAAQYDNLMKNGGINPADAPNPDWYGGAWIDNSYYPEAKLAVAIVDGFRTTELEAQIEEWCGGEVVFQDAKYALAYLYALQDTVVDAITGGSNALSCGIGVDVTANCLGVDIYSDGSPVPDAVLAKLAQLDPAGDAIRVRVFTGRLDTLTDEIVKGPAPGGVTQPAPGAVEDAERETSQIAPDPSTIPELSQEKQNAIAEGE